MLDESHLVAHSEELPSAIQALYDQRGPATGHPPFKVILCGSAISEMSRLLSGDQALYGRAVLDLSSTISVMASVGARELSHNSSRYLARVKAGQSLEVTERGRVIAVISPAVSDRPVRPRPKVGGYRSERPLTAGEIDAELARGFGDDDRR